MTDTSTPIGALEFQRDYCAKHGSPIVARICQGLIVSLDRSSQTGRRALDWPGNATRDALPLRMVAAFHALYRARRCAALDALFEGYAGDPAPPIRAAIADHDAEIATWLEGPPQTNETGRSSLFAAGLLLMAARFGLPFDLLEIGSSAGLNLLMDRFRYRLGNVEIGPDDATVRLEPEWRGNPPPFAKVEIASIRGVDIHPFDLSDPGAADRLLAYVWVDQAERITRTKAAIDLWRARPPRLDTGGAGDWVEARLAEPQEEGHARVLMHSVVWQYLSDEEQARIGRAMNAAGVRATETKPLGWVRLEPDEKIRQHVLMVRQWPGGEDKVYAAAQPHGAWVEWFDQPSEANRFSW